MPRMIPGARSITVPNNADSLGELYIYEIVAAGLIVSWRGHYSCASRVRIFDSWVCSVSDKSRVFQASMAEAFVTAKLHGV